jgi:hypothetical protein
MATLLLTGIGTLLGGPLGGALGALAGRQIDQAIIGTGTRKGPRLKELTVQASSYGAAIPRVYGRMRIAGSVIWATDLAEHRDKHSGGKGQPKTVSYTYSSSFAVALSSRPIVAVGRIWADGSLLRGADGALKVAGTLRVHTGEGDQQVDPLLGAAEARGACPAFRGCAYAVFEDLQLAEFGNRIPSLSFEVIADDGEVGLTEIVSDIVPEAIVAPIARSLVGYSIEGGSAGDALDEIGQAVPLCCTCDGDALAIAPAEASSEPVSLLPVSVAGEDANSDNGFKRHREPLPRQRLAAVRYYDVSRDFQPGVQQGRGRALPGDVATIEFPAAIEASTARALADAASLRAARAQDTATYRIGELDPALAPGKLARIAGQSATWRIEEWEWSSTGVELTLRALPLGQASPGPADPGRASVAVDLSAGTTELAALELPWDGLGSGNSPALFAAVSSASAGWKGAALHAVQPDGSLVPLGASGRVRAVLGTTVGALGSGSPLALDRASTLEVQLVGADLALTEASLAQLAMGGNRALVGEEIIQFGRAEPLGNGRWWLTDLLRGRGGTEHAVAGHAANERFVLLDEALVPLDPLLVGDAAHARIAAGGLADPVPVVGSITLAGSTLRPLSPVSGEERVAANGTLSLTWVRRARGAWLWQDGVDAPVAEQSERYVVTLGDPSAPVATWETTEPALTLTADVAAALHDSAAGASFTVRQQGSGALSEALVLGTLP